MPLVQDMFFSAQDGLKLYVKRHGNPGGQGIPVFCLPGISRNTDDFDVLARHLTADGQRLVYAMDYRGRGKSAYDKTWQNYDLKVELGDLADVLAALNIHKAIFIGTSRGGILTMLLPMIRPGLIAGVVLNDIGPVIEAKGLMRIKSYVGKLPSPRTLDEGAAILKQVSSSQFPTLSEEGWRAFAARTWAMKDGSLALRYDANLFKTLETLDFGQPIPTLWPQFEALHPSPVLVIRGALSDILSQETAEEMTRRLPNCHLHTVAQEGHAPLLEDVPTITRIQALITEAETG